MFIPSSTDPPVEACGIRPTDMHSSWPEKLFMENDGPTNPPKGLKAVNNWVSGWFQYDHTAEKVTKEAFIASNDHPIRPSTVEAAPDAERLLRGSYPPSFESENLIMSGLTLGAFMVIALNVLDPKSRHHGKEHRSGTVSSSEGETIPFSGPSTGEEDLISTKKLSWLWCENAAWCCAYNPHIHRKEFGFDGSDSMRKMVAIPNANHFVRQSVALIRSVLTWPCSFNGKIQRGSSNMSFRSYSLPCYFKSTFSSSYLPKCVSLQHRYPEGFS
jgi:hypothetical protein